MTMAPRSSLHGASACGRGFTLIELLVTIAILAIMLAVGVPSFQSFVSGQKVKTASYDLTIAMVQARSEAIKRNASVTVAPVTANDWVSGWTVKVGATTLLEQEALTGLTVTKAAAATAIPATFNYGAAGRLTNPSADNDGVQYLQVTGGTSVRCVRIDATGVPSSTGAACP